MEHRPLNRIVLADDPVAADATCARLMGLDPDRITHIRVGAQFFGNSSEELIHQLAEPLDAPPCPFRLVPAFEYLGRVVRLSPGISREPTYD